MKLTQSKLRLIVQNLVAEMGLSGRPATVDEIAKIVQAVLAEAEGRKPEPLAPKLVVPECPDDESAKQALFTICSPLILYQRLSEIPSCDCFLDPFLKRGYVIVYARFSHQDEIREVLAQFGVCPRRRQRPPTDTSRPGRYTCRMVVRVPKDWRLSPKP